MTSTVEVRMPYTASPTQLSVPERDVQTLLAVYGDTLDDRLIGILRRMRPDLTSDAVWERITFLVQASEEAADALNNGDTYAAIDQAKDSYLVELARLAVRPGTGLTAVMDAVREGS